MPIADARHGDVFTPLFDTPHSVDFEGVCRSMGLEYRRADTKGGFREAFLESQGGWWVGVLGKIQNEGLVATLSQGVGVRVGVSTTVPPGNDFFLVGWT